MAVVECRLYQRSERLYVHTDRVCSGLGGALPKEIMIRGGRKSVAMVVQYEYTSEERDAFLARALNRYTEGSDVVQIVKEFESDRARGVHDDPRWNGMSSRYNQVLCKRAEPVVWRMDAFRQATGEAAATLRPHVIVAGDE